MAFSKIKNEDKERILRTVYVGQVDLSLSEDDVKNHFSDCGVVTKVALAGDVSHPTRFAFVEFTDLASAKKALLKTDTIMCGRTIRVRPSKTPIYQAEAELDGSRKRSREEDGSGNIEDKRPRY
jgi:RNA recognition motif-containing protein